MSDQRLYERLGGVFAIAAVVDHFSDAVVRNPIVGQQSQNPALREWHTQNLGRLPGLKFMRTLWVCNVAGGPFEYTATVPGSTVRWACPSRRRARCSPPSPPTRTRSPRATGAERGVRAAPTRRRDRFCSIRNQTFLIAP
jgi:hypothetical protein